MSSARTNIPLETQITKLVTEYDEVSGGDDGRFPLATPSRSHSWAAFRKSPTVTRAKEAFEVGLKRRMEDREKIDSLFDDILAAAEADRGKRRLPRLPGLQLEGASSGLITRRTIARNSPTRSRNRSCRWFASWTPSARPTWASTCFGRGIWRSIRSIASRCTPFDPKDIESFVSTTKQLFERLSPALAEEFESLRTHGNLDLDSRKGKQPGGYQISLDESKQPFIFMNAAGSQRDVETLLHEGGHAFHFIASANNEPLTFLRQAPMEFCEVASMAMEALSSEHFDLFYKSEEDALRAKQSYLEAPDPFSSPLDGDRSTSFTALALHHARPQPRPAQGRTGSACWTDSAAVRVGKGTRRAGRVRGSGNCICSTCRF